MPYKTPSKEERNKQFLAALQPQQPNSDPYQIAAFDKNKKFLIVCEGEVTEKQYLEHFPVVTKEVITVIGGFGGGKQYLVNEARKIVQSNKYEGYEVWCVFDFDVKHDNPNQKQDYNNAITNALNEGFRVAYSNDCFELWMVLHYKYIQSAHHRTEYYGMLDEIWKLERSYESTGKEEKFARGLYDKLLLRQETALKHAKKLYKFHDTTSTYHEKNPCTTVFELVEELNKYLRR